MRFLLCFKRLIWLKVSALSFAGRTFIFAAAAMLAPEAGHTQETKQNHRIDRTKTPMLTGPLGLNLVPSARFSAPGTVSFTTSTSDPYSHLVIGSQITDHIYFGLRQTAQSSSLTNLSDQLYPGMDLKLKLLDEGAYTPAVAVGLQSAFGHKRQAGEYLVFSKRFHDFDFSGGMAWGRLGSAAHIDNPLGKIAGHFGKNRPLDGVDPNDPGDWFTGKDIGFFAGIEYAPQDSDFSIKADWGADRYIQEIAAIEGFDAPSPWSVSLDYHPKPYVSANVGVVGGEKIMGRLTLRGMAQNWPWKFSEDTKAPPVYPYRSGETSTNRIQMSAFGHDMVISPPVHQNHEIITALELDHSQTSPKQYGRLLRAASLDGGRETERLTIQPVNKGLKGRPVSLLRASLERLEAKAGGSPEEIWHNTKIGDHPKSDTLSLPSFIRDGSFILEQDISLAEDDSSLIERTALLYESETPITNNLFAGYRTRLNLSHNLQRLDDFAFLNNDNPVRSDLGRFADQTVTLDRLYAAVIATPYPDLHLAVSTGYLEEVYGGIHASALYRPFGKTYGIGAELANVRRRDPATAGNFGYETGTTLTGHLNLFYEIPDSSMTFEVKLGRYLAGDWGGTFGLTNRFKNGASLHAFITATDERDRDIFGGKSNLYGGLKFTFPIGTVPYIPDGTRLAGNFTPIGRNAGQILNGPIDLYERSEPLSKRHLLQNWSDIVE